MNCNVIFIKIILFLPNYYFYKNAITNNVVKFSDFLYYTFILQNIYFILFETSFRSYTLRITKLDSISYEDQMLLNRKNNNIYFGITERILFMSIGVLDIVIQ